MNDQIKKTIIDDITKICNSNNPVKYLNVEDILNNLDQIINIINNNTNLKQILKTDKNVWLIEKRLGILDNGKIQDYIDMCKCYGKQLNYNYDISPKYSFFETADILRRKFCINIRRIYVYLEKCNDTNRILIDLRNQYKKAIVNNQKLQNRNEKLEYDNQELLNTLKKLEEINRERFLTEALVKVKKYIK